MSNPTLKIHDWHAVIDDDGRLVVVAEDPVLAELAADCPDDHTMASVTVIEAPAEQVKELIEAAKEWREAAHVMAIRRKLGKDMVAANARMVAAISRLDQAIEAITQQGQEER